MAFNKDNSGSLSRNQNKTKETAPDMKGKATVAGVEYWISGWTKENANGKWLSLSFEPKDQEQPASKIGEIPRVADNDVPW